MTEQDRNTLVAQLFDRYYDRLVLYYKRRLWFIPELHDMAEECVQDVFHTALKRYAKLLDHPDIKGCYFRTCENNIRNIYKKYIGRSRRHAYSADDETSPELHDPHDTFRIVEEQSNYERLIDRVHAELLENEKKIFDDYFLHGYDIEEVARLSEKSVSSVKSSLFRMRKRLAKKFFTKTFILLFWAHLFRF